MRERESNPERDRPKRRLRRFGEQAIKFANPESWAAAAIRKAADPEAWWDERYKEAAAFMETRASAPKTLIVVAAQDGLIDGLYPNEEFETRLEYGLSGAWETVDAGGQVEFYVPGSLHRQGNIDDKIPLATAGLNWLTEQDLPPGIVLHGDDANQTYKGEDGVYHSGDEALVATSLFKNNAEFGAFELYCGPHQTRRWGLQAIANGVVATVHTVIPPTETHNIRAERIADLYTYHCDPTWQSRASLLAVVTRRMRVPRGPDI